MNKKEKETQIADKSSLDEIVTDIANELNLIINSIADELELNADQKQRFIKETVKRINKEFNLIEGEIMCNKEKMQRPAPWPDPPEKLSKLNIGDDNGDLQSIYAIEDKINEIVDFLNKEKDHAKDITR